MTNYRQRVPKFCQNYLGLIVREECFPLIPIPSIEISWILHPRFDIMGDITYDASLWLTGRG
jgi:hypothetical protein